MEQIKEKLGELRKLETKKVIPVIIVLLFAIPVLAATTLVNSEEFSFNANATATNVTLENETELGVVTDPTLQFGEVPTEAQVTKKLQVESGQKTLAHLQSTGNISENLEHPDKKLFEDETEIEVKFNATQPGYYEGTVEMTTQTPERTGGETWINLRSKLP